MVLGRLPDTTHLRPPAVGLRSGCGWESHPPRACGMWYKLVIAYLLAFPALLTSLYCADRVWRSSFGLRIRSAVQPRRRHYELHALELARGQRSARIVLLVE